ncbi:OLC1v1025099C1 [Oldenlandia corymbosa var. corymbosa]|uniref:OLC1v1025099C1 n=1 Tax=Oldenlandia corymbosa var. corymbosa TaxID=529605 RepID=A0AAV1C636_OLDCO|nr:OLC1v1025099C1 [Oldenlandia corymbosa var. corymbosa]
MEKHVQILLNKISYASITIATVVLLGLIIQTPSTCVDPTAPDHPTSKRASQTLFPTSTCDYTHRAFTSLEKKNRRLWSSKMWIHAVDSYKALFSTFQAQTRSHLFNHSRALVVSAGPGQAVMALREMGVADVTGVEVVDSPPLVSRADPHNLPFFDDVFDFGFSGYLDRALFPIRYVEEMERTVKIGGICVVAVEECGDEEVREIVKFFRKSRFLNARNVSLAGEERTAIVMRVQK